MNDVACSVQHVTAAALNLQRKPLLALWFRGGDYCIDEMCTTLHNLAALRKAFFKCRDLNDIAIVVGLGPTPDTISDIL